MYCLHMAGSTIIGVQLPWSIPANGRPLGNLHQNNTLARVQWMIVATWQERRGRRYDKGRKKVAADWHNYWSGNKSEKSGKNPILATMCGGGRAGGNYRLVSILPNNQTKITGFVCRSFILSPPTIKSSLSREWRAGVKPHLLSPIYQNVQKWR